VPTLDEAAASLGSELTEEFRRAVEVLGRVGLTQYEARAYIALVTRGVGDASTVAHTAGIPRTSAYKVLESLAAKGYAQAAGGKPLLFRAKPPNDVATSLKEDIAEVFEKLALLHRLVAEHGEPQLVYLLNGRERVMGKIAEMLDQSVKEFLLTTPQIAELREELAKKAASAIRRGVQVTWVTGPHQRVPEGVRYIPRANLLATEVLTDGAHALLAAPGLDACGFTDNPILTAHLKQFLDVILDLEPVPPS
jgi:sugar-specific transcriptional regulator TrmB